MKEAVTKVFDTLTQEDFHRAFQKLFERYNKCIAAGGDYFEGDLSFMYVPSIKVPIRKSLETYLMILVYRTCKRIACRQQYFSTTQSPPACTQLDSFKLFYLTLTISLNPTDSIAHSWMVSCFVNEKLFLFDVLVVRKRNNRQQIMLVFKKR